MSELTKKSLSELANLIKKKEIKSEELTKSFIENIKKDKKLNSFITHCEIFDCLAISVHSDLMAPGEYGGREWHQRSFSSSVLEVARWRKRVERVPVVALRQGTAVCTSDVTF